MIHKFKPKSEFSRNVLTLMTGTTIAQAIPIAISPILTRIYTPDDFGIFALYMSIASIMAAVATGRYELAIMLPKKDEDAINIVALSIIISFFVSFISFLIVFIFNSEITTLLGTSEISNWLYFIPITVLLTGIYQSFNYWSNRQKHYKRLAKNKVMQSGTTATTNLGMGFSGFGSSGLIIGSIMGQGFATVFLGKTIVKSNKSLLSKVNKLKMFVLAKKYIDYPRKSAIGAFFNVLAYKVEIILLSIFYIPYFLGLYYFVNRFVNIPKQFLSSSIWQVFLANSGQSIQSIFDTKVYKQKKILRYSTFPLITGIFIYTDLFIFVFGSNWSDATTFISPLVIAMHINFIVASFSLFVLINRPDAEMVFNILLALVKILAIVMSYYIWKDILYTIIVFSTTQFIMFYILGSWNYKQLEKSIFYFGKIYLSYFIPSLIVLFLLTIFFSESILIQKLLMYMFINLLYFGVIKYVKL